MKKTLIITAICIIVLYFAFYAYIYFNDPMKEMYRDRIEYPLASVNIHDNSEYMLFETGFGIGDSFAVITDTQMIKENASVFSVENDGSIYGTTPDAQFSLYKDGEYIGSVWFDYDGGLTKKIEYGTLEFQPINELQYLLLLGCEFIEQGEHYSIIANNQANPYYYCFAHGEDLEKPEQVQRVYAASDISEIPRPVQVYGDIVEFAAHFPTYAGDETAYWYFRLSDYRLSRMHLNVKAVHGQLIACTGGLRLIVCDMFDRDDFYMRFAGDFSEQAGRLFLLSAEFTDDGKLNIEYLGNDEQVHSKTYNIW